MVSLLNISTLIHPAPRRAQLLDQCVRSVLAHTDIPWKLRWTIYCNGTSEELRNIIVQLGADFRDRVSIVGVFGGENRGLGFGINQANVQCEGDCYTLLLEGDWFCLHPDDSGQPRTWLIDSINLLDREPDVDAVYLRRYYCDIDSRQTGLHSHYQHLVRPPRKEGIRYFVSDFRSYTNNPLVRRNQRFYDKGIFPLFEPWEKGEPQEFKGNEKWGLCEIEAERMMEKQKIDLRMAVLNWGVFTHIENSQIEDDRIVVQNPGCGKAAHGAAGCKWGYYDMAPHFCALCQEGFLPHQLDRVFAREGHFLQEVEALKEAHAPREAFDELMLKWNSNPTRPRSEIDL